MQRRKRIFERHVFSGIQLYGFTWESRSNYCWAAVHHAFCDHLCLANQLFSLPEHLRGFFTSFLALHHIHFIEGLRGGECQLPSRDLVLEFLSYSVIRVQPWNN